MATLLENQIVRTSVEKEAELHNAQIKERYRRLQEAEADQFAETETVATNNATDFITRAFVASPTAPVQEQVPEVTEYVRERIDSPVFTTEKFERLQNNATVVNAVPVQFPVQTVTRLAKTVMAAFAAVVVLMLTLICVNTNLINQKSYYLRSLEAQKQELVETYSEIQARLERATSDDAIEEWAQANGMIRGE